MVLCDICATEYISLGLGLPVCQCKTLNRCSSCHFKQLAAPGKGGVCDVCHTERCEVRVLSVLPFTSQLYPWSQALHTDAVTPERCPTLLFESRHFHLLTMFGAWFQVVAVGCVMSMAMASDDELFSATYCVLLALLTVQSAVDSLTLAVYADSTQDRRFAYRVWTTFTLFQWIVVVAVVAGICETFHSRALLIGLFLASRSPGWCVDAALLLCMRWYLASQLKDEINVVGRTAIPVAPEQVDTVSA